MILSKVKAIYIYMYNLYKELFLDIKMIEKLDLAKID